MDKFILFDILKSNMVYFKYNYNIKDFLGQYVYDKS